MHAYYPEVAHLAEKLAGQTQTLAHGARSRSEEHAQEERDEVTQAACEYFQWVKVAEAVEEEATVVAAGAVEAVEAVVAVEVVVMGTAAETATTPQTATIVGIATTVAVVTQAHAV